MRILFLNPPTGIYFREDRCQMAANNLLAAAEARTPLDLAYPAAIAREEGCECMIRDYPAMGLGWSAYVDDLKSFTPDAVFVSTTLFSVVDDLRAVTEAKSLFPEILTIAKGPYFMEDGEQAFSICPELDMAIPGETEMVVRDIVAGMDREDISGIIFRRDGELVVNPERPVEMDLDRFGFPARDLLDNALYIRPDTQQAQTTVLASRGCPYKCVYCLAPVVSGRRDRWRSVGSVVREIRECVEQHGVTSIHLEADEFTLRRNWVLDLCDKLEALEHPVSWVCNSRVDTVDYELVKRMKAAGCWLISLGVESGSQEMLDKMRKNATLEQARTAVEACRRAGVLTYSYFVIGLPWDSHKTVRATIDFAISLNPDFAEFYIAYPFKGTEFRRLVEAEGLFVAESAGQVKFGDKSEPEHRTFHLAPDEIARYAKEATRRFYFRPRYILKQLARVRDPRVMKNYIRYGLRLIAKMASS